VGVQRYSALWGSRMAGGTKPDRGMNRLTDRQVRTFITQARAGTAPKKKLSDGGGLFIHLNSAGSPCWRVKYRVNGKERLAGPGIYPEVSLVEARAARDALRTHLRYGRDPSIERVNRSGSSATFRDVANEWLDMRRKGWSKIHYEKSSQAIERDVMPRLGGYRIADITAAVVAPVVQSIAERGSVETAGKVLQHINSIFRFAEGKGLCSSNPAIAAKELLPRKREHSQRPALLTFNALGDILRRADMAMLSPAVRMAHRLIAFTGTRIGNVITAEWDEFDLGDSPRWTIPRNKMKMKDRTHDHVVLLGPTIANELATWKAMTGGKGFVFPSPTGREHITHESLEKVYRVTLKLDGKHSPHGWRSSFSTLAKENGFSREAVELALDHIADTAVVRAYDRGDRLQERIRLSSWWDEQLVAAQSGGGA
jgi:integrase